jgi:acyl transferase domain-containing protein
VNSGAVKSNIGHLEGGSGIAGIIKAVLVLEKGIIPPNTNFETLNPKIDLDYLRIRVRSRYHFPQTRG